jgi:hypothetical protein
VLRGADCKKITNYIFYGDGEFIKKASRIKTNCIFYVEAYIKKIKKNKKNKNFKKGSASQL